MSYIFFSDSAYFSISNDSLESVIKPDMLQQFKNVIYGSHNEKNYEASLTNWFPRMCCDYHTKFDKRTPGLFKVKFMTFRFVKYIYIY